MPLDDDDKKFIGDLISASLAATFKPDSDFMKTMEANADRRTKSLRDSILSDVDGKLEGLKPAGDGKGAGDDVDSKSKSKGKASEDVDPEVAKLRDSVERLRNEAKTAREQAEAEAAQRKQDRLESAFRDHAIAAGIPAERVAAALNHVKGLGILKYNDDGRPGLQFTRSWGDEIVPFGGKGEQSALGTFLGTDDGKIFVPPVNTQGTGEGGGNRGQNHGTGSQRFITADGELDSRAMGSHILQHLSQIPG